MTASMPSEPDSSLAGKDLSGQDLRYTDLSDKVLFDTDLRGAQLYGVRLSMLCQQFDGVKLDNTQIASLLMIISQADIDPRFKQGLNALVESVAGSSSYKALQRMLRLA
jgi:uncharacterized protein YjbI with pentapeptide repeats